MLYEVITCAGVRVHTPPPVSVPAESAAPAGTPEIVIARLSEPSVVITSYSIHYTKLYELPDVSATVSVGASASGFTVTVIVSTVVAVSPPFASVAVEVMVSVKSVSLSEGGVTVRPVSCAGVSVQTPPPVSVV